MITSQMETKCKQTNFTCKADMKPILRDRIIKMICPLPLLKMLMKALKYKALRIENPAALCFSMKQEKVNFHTTFCYILNRQ